MDKVAALRPQQNDQLNGAELAVFIGDRWVSMGNALNRAGHGLTLSEKRLVALALTKIDSRKKLPSGTILKTRIFALEYAEAFDVDADTAYTQLRSAGKSLRTRKITFYEPAHRRGSKVPTPTQHDMQWIGRASYQDGEGWIELAWWPELLPALTGLKKNFTSYQLKQASALRSVYSWRLLELLTRFESGGKGWAEYEIEDFRTSMDAPPSLSDYGQIKRRIIDPAVAELTQKDGWDIQIKELKAGRKVKALRFDFKRDEQLRLALT